jgi:AI-2 transport protein TqsA
MRIMDVTAAAVLVVLVFYILVVGEALLLPLVVAITLWFLINLLSSAFHSIPIGKFRIPKPLCLLASLMSFVGLGWSVVNIFSASIADVMDVVPQYQVNLENRLRGMPFSMYLLDAETGRLSGVIFEGGWLNLPAIFTSLAASFTSIVTRSGIIIIYIVFLFLEQGAINRKIGNLVNNPGKEKKVRRILSQISKDIHKYIGIKIFTSSLTGILSYGVLLLIGVDFAAVWAMLIFLLNFIPTVGSIIATIFPALIALAQFQGYTEFFLVLGGIGFLQQAIGNVLEPRIMGTSFNLSPLLILLNLGLWGYIWGVIGMFLCVPFLIIIYIVLAHFPQTRPIAVMLSSDGRVAITDD